MIAFPLRPADPRGPTVDVLIAAPVSAGEALARAECREVEGLGVPLACVEDMIRLKENTGRAQDAANIRHLHRLRDEAR